MICIIKNSMKTDGSLVALICRLTLGLVMLPHGLQKTVGLFGGHGFSGTMGFLTGAVGLPAIIAFLVIAAESVGALALIVGFFTRFSAASLAVVMAGAAWIGHGSNGFFMNWFGQQQGEGFEYHLLAIGLALALVVGGGGRLSLDGALCKRCCNA
jgi:putative oxidoreductase